MSEIYFFLWLCLILSMKYEFIHSRCYLWQHLKLQVAWRAFTSWMIFRYFCSQQRKARADDDDENPRMMKIDMKQLLEIFILCKIKNLWKLKRGFTWVRRRKFRWGILNSRRHQKLSNLFDNFLNIPQTPPPPQINSKLFHVH